MRLFMYGCVCMRKGVGVGVTVDAIAGVGVDVDVGVGDMCVYCMFTLCSLCAYVNIPSVFIRHYIFTYITRENIPYISISSRTLYIHVPVQYEDCTYVCMCVLHTRVNDTSTYTVHYMYKYIMRTDYIRMLCNVLIRKMHLYYMMYLYV